MSRASSTRSRMRDTPSLELVRRSRASLRADIVVISFESTPSSRSSILTPDDFASYRRASWRRRGGDLIFMPLAKISSRSFSSFSSLERVWVSRMPSLISSRLTWSSERSFFFIPRKSIKPMLCGLRVARLLLLFFLRVLLAARLLASDGFLQPFPEFQLALVHLLPGLEHFHALVADVAALVGGVVDHSEEGVELLEIDLLADLVVLEEGGQLEQVVLLQALEDVLDGDLALPLEDAPDPGEGHEFLDHAGQLPLDHRDALRVIAEAARVDAAPRGGLGLRALVEDVLAELVVLVDLPEVLVLPDFEALLLDPDLLQAQIGQPFLPLGEDFSQDRHVIPRT